MGVYRLYFLDPARLILAAEVFDARDDDHALTMASHLADACSDECSGFELWQMDRLVGKEWSGVPAPQHRVSDVTAAMQASLLDREEAIRNSRWRISQSRKLLERIESVRGSLRGK